MGNDVGEEFLVLNDRSRGTSVKQNGALWEAWRSVQSSVSSWVHRGDLFVPRGAGSLFVPRIVATVTVVVSVDPTLSSSMATTVVMRVRVRGGDKGGLCGEEKVIGRG